MVIKYEFKDLTSQGLKISGIVPVLDEMLNLLDVNNPMYLLDLQSLYEEVGSTSKMLDILGNLFGIRRVVSIIYVNSSNIEVTEELSLSDEEFLTYIRCQIIKNNYNGSYKQFKAYYEIAGLQVGVLTKNSVFSPTDSATANLYLIKNEKVTENIEKLFLSGALTIASLGIKYEYSSMDLASVLIWKGTGKDGQYYEGVNTWYDPTTQTGGIWL